MYFLLFVERDPLGIKSPPSGGPISENRVVRETRNEFTGAPSGKRVAKKILAKSGDAAFQYEILKVRNWERMREPDEPPRTRIRGENNHGFCI